MVIDQVNTLGWAMASMKVTTVPTSTTNMTGFLTCTRGSSFLKASTRARPRISRSNRLRASATPWAWVGRRVRRRPAGAGGIG